MVEDGVQLRVHALLHDLRRVLAVERVHLVVAELLELLGGVFDLRREQNALRQQLDLLALRGDGVRVADNGVVAELFAEVGKLREHLVRRLEIDGQRLVRVGELAPGEQDVAENFVAGVEEVDVAGGDEGLAERCGDAGDAAV